MSGRHTGRKRRGRARLLVIMSWAALMAWSGPAAGSGETWNPPRSLAASAIPVRDPILLEDPSGIVHLFYSASRSAKPKLPDTLMYLRRDEQGWSTPVVLLDVPEGEPLAAPALALDGRGVLHVVYNGPNGNVMYRRAHLSRIRDAEGWTDAQRLTEDHVLSSTLVATDEHTLHVLSASRGGVVFYVRSDDGGRNWSDPVRVAAAAREQAAAAPDLAVDGTGRLHATWTEYHLPAGWPPAGGYYSRSLNGGQSWSPPRQFAGERHGWGKVIARGAGEIHIVWNAVAAIGDRMHQWSRDGGDTWTDPELISTDIRGGWTGAPAIAFDSTGRLHVVTSVDGPDDVERMFHLTWHDGRWSSPELISGGTVATDSVEFPTLALGGGNRLHVAYEVDYRQIWYADGTTDAPVIARRPIPTPATDLWSRAVETSIGLRVFAGVLAALAIDAALRGAWRMRRRGQT